MKDVLRFVAAIICSFTVFASCIALFVYVGWWSCWIPLVIVAKLFGGSYITYESIIEDHPEYADKTKYRITYYDGRTPLTVTDLETGEEKPLLKKGLLTKDAIKVN